MRYVLISCCCLLLLSPFAYAGVCTDSFDDGNDNGWKVVIGEWVVQEGAYVQLKADPSMRVPRTIIQSPWDFTDGTIEVTITFDKKSEGAEVPAVLYRMIDEENGYVFRLHSDSLEVGRLLNGQFDYIRGDAFPIDINKPCRMKLEVEGIFTKVYYNGVIKIRVGEPDPKKGFEKGRIGFAVFEANRPVYFDDLVIEGQNIHAFPPMDQKVEPGRKLASIWGGIKTCR